MDFIDLHSQFTPCGHRELLRTPRRKSDLKDLNPLVQKNTEVCVMPYYHLTLDSRLTDFPGIFKHFD